MRRKIEGLLARIPIIPINFLSTAITSFILIALSFALYLPSLGFYLDDWPQLYSLVVRGVDGIKTYFLFDDRPFGWWPDFLVFKVWGTNPLGWHLVNYLLRWFVGLGIWAIFTRIWRNHRKEIFWVVQLFAVFPLFNQQSMGLTFIAHWFCYVLFFLSLYLMLLATRETKWRIPLIILSLAASAINLFTYENFIGIEFLRPLLLWLMMRDQPKRKRIKRTILFWLPFLTLAVFYVVWRVLLMQNIRGLDPVLLSQLFKDPVNTILTLINFAIRDLTFMILAVWFPTVDPTTFDLSVPNLFYSYILAIVVGVSLTLLYINSQDDEDKLPFESSDLFRKELLLVGILGILFGCAPGWLVGKSVTGADLWVDRFGLPAMWASPLVIIWIALSIGQQRPKVMKIILIVLIALAVGKNFSIVNDYKWSTIWQNRVMSQLKWRAPLVKPNTAFLSSYELFPKVGVYPTSYMLNILYPNTQELDIVDYWFFTIQKYFPDNKIDLVKGIEIYQGHWYSKFVSNSRDSLVLGWNTTNPHCLWILTENDRYNPGIDEATRLVLGASNLERVLTDQTIPWPDENLFGNENRNTWCYYYEKADLERQNGNWQEVVDLYSEAVNLGYKPTHGAEYIPFIEAYAHIGKADEAAILTDMAKKKNENMQNYTCDTWNRLASEITNDSLFDEQYRTISERDSCQDLR